MGLTITEQLLTLIPILSLKAARDVFPPNNPSCTLWSDSVSRESKEVPVLLEFLLTSSVSGCKHNISDYVFSVMC